MAKIILGSVWFLVTFGLITLVRQNISEPVVILWSWILAPIFALPIPLVFYILFYRKPA